MLSVDSATARQAGYPGPVSTDKQQGATGAQAMDLKSWHEEIKANHWQTLDQLTSFILECCLDDEATYQRLYTIAITACYQAKLFDKSGSYEHIKRQNDRDFMQDKGTIISALDKLTGLIERHHKLQTQALTTVVGDFFVSLRLEKSINLQPVSGRRPCNELLIDTLQTLKETLLDDNRFTFLYEEKHGCFLYPGPVNGASLPTAHRMLAVYLVVLFRLISSGQIEQAIQNGWKMPSTGTGKPKHGLVDDLIQMTFNREINSQEVETSFRKNSPGLAVVSWNCGQPASAPP